MICRLDLKKCISDPFVLSIDINSAVEGKEVNYS